ncbi:L-alanine-DL-glutamate epimerase-like enolase superfamily enzyme [Sphingobium sp. B11D3B]|uniref:mandelate racemase/muconate lactonizing enzyme family protein n=1 Tax=Sphingobium sp. B11D3B TaxID=2940575 RepID=UPI002225E27B|nr:mandelate racemase/muconate lactonizing enzyme family protein [Sphingobium sp. B11D3B]MCW2389285.1 L-alanine-DL-glutamate epimerase-like enolase superfamily enzyme [Sphingobium sp. B11D3B]
MKITGAKVMGATVNFEGVMAGTHIVLRLMTDQGIEGIGSVSRVSPRTLKPLILLIEAMVESLIGHEAEVEPIHDRLTRPLLGAPVSGLELRAGSAIDVALWDIKGKAVGQPVWKLMGGFRNRLPVSANWGLMPGPPKDALAAHIADLLGRGFRAIKCPVGFAPLATAIEHVHFVRSCAGPDVRIIVDGNFQWTAKQALHFARETEADDLYWIEDPVAYHDYDGMAFVRANARQAICAGEVFQHPHEFRALMEKRGSDYVMIDQDLGLTGFLKVAHMAQAHGLPVVNHLAPETLSHAIAAVPNGLIVGLVPWAQPLFREKLQVEDGDLILSDRPGLGLSLDEDVLERNGPGA